MESLEFDGYFRPQKHATCEMCSGIFLRPALDLFFFFLHDREMSRIYPHIFLHSTFYIFF